MHWQLDGSNLGVANASLLWSPTGGSHRLALVARSGHTIDSVTFQVRGAREIIAVDFGRPIGD